MLAVAGLLEFASGLAGGSAGWELGGLGEQQGELPTESVRGRDRRKDQRENAAVELERSLLAKENPKPNG